MPTLTTSPLGRRLKDLRRRIRAVLRDHPFATTFALTALIVAELRKATPELAKLLTPELLRGWLTSARSLTRELPPIISPPPPPAAFLQPGSGPRWPAIEAAVKDLLRRDVLTWPEYLTLTDEAKNTAFSVARVLTEVGVEQVRENVAEAVAEGMTLKEFRRRMPADSWLSEPQVETVFRTQIGQARGAGMRAVLRMPAVAAAFPYVAYFATHDSRVGDHVPGLPCPTHLMMEQLGIQGTNIYRADDPVILKFWPPWRWNCRCHVVPISLDDAAAAGVREAMLWQRTGVPPVSPAWVPHPPFDLPPGWPRAGVNIRPLVP